MDVDAAAEEAADEAGSATPVVVVDAPTDMAAVAVPAASEEAPMDVEDWSSAGTLTGFPSGSLAMITSAPAAGENPPPVPQVALSSIAISHGGVSHPLIHALASTLPSLRMRALRKASPLLASRSLSPLDMRKLTRALLYALWMADGEAAAGALAKRLATAATTAGWPMVSLLLDEVGAAWAGLDRLRLDKVYATVSAVAAAGVDRVVAAAAAATAAEPASDAAAATATSVATAAGLAGVFSSLIENHKDTGGRGVVLHLLDAYPRLVVVPAATGGVTWSTGLAALTRPLLAAAAYGGGREAVLGDRARAALAEAAEAVAATAIATGAPSPLPPQSAATAAAAGAPAAASSPTAAAAAVAALHEAVFAAAGAEGVPAAGRRGLYKTATRVKVVALQLGVAV